MLKTIKKQNTGAKSMLGLKQLPSLMMALLISIFTIACGGGSDSVDMGENLLTCNAPLIINDAGTACVDRPALSCPAPLVANDDNTACVVGANPDLPDPIVFAGENQAILFYNRPQDASNAADDPVYDGYILHTWNNEECDSYAEPHNASTWGEEHDFDGIDPNYGAYWIVNLKPDHGDCANFIIHIGTDDAGKELGGGDWKMNLVQDDETFQRMNFTLSGYPAVFEYPITSLGELPTCRYKISLNTGSMLIHLFGILMRHLRVKFVCIIRQLLKSRWMMILISVVLRLFLSQLN